MKQFHSLNKYYLPFLPIGDLNEELTIVGSINGMFFIAIINE